MQADLVLLQLFEGLERIGGGAECAIKFRGDNNITRLKRRQEPLTFRTIRERHRTGHTGLDEDDLLLLLVERKAAICLLPRTYTCDTCGKDISDGSGAMHRGVQ